MQLIGLIRNARGRRQDPPPTPPGPAMQGSLDRLASALFNALRREDQTWQERAIAAAGPEHLLKALDPAAQWFRTVLVDGWPVYPVHVRELDAWLIPGRAISDGYPLRAVYFPAFDYLRTASAKEKPHVEATVARLRGRTLPRATGGRLGVLVAGHDNFAHVFLSPWNALSRGRRAHGFRGVATLHEHLAQSMGSATEPELFPELAARIRGFGWRFRFRDRYAGTLLPLGVGRDTVFNFHLDTDLRTAVRAVARRTHSDAARAIARQLREAEAVLWVSVRAAGPRDARNFRDWMAATIAAVERRDVRPFVVFDGLSIQPGFNGKSVIRGEPSNAQIRRERTLVASIMAGSNLEHASISGLPLYDAFHLSTFASFFVCHAGTLDHKIKWLNPNVPGVVHGNLERHATYAWDPTADLVRALYLPARFIHDEKPEPSDGEQIIYAQYPYRIEPMEEAAAWVADELVRALDACRVPARGAAPSGTATAS